MNLEAELAQCPPGKRLTFERSKQYDMEYGLFHQEGHYEPVHVDPGPDGSPSTDWIRHSLRQLVLGEGGGRSLPRAAPRLEPLGKRRIEIESFPVERYLELCEEQYVYGGLADNLVGSADLPQSVRFLSLVGSRWLGNPANRRNLTPLDVEAPLRQAARHRAPIQLVLPAMPFKDQCAFRTNASPDHIDLGEMAFLVRLHCLALAINQMHAYDSECIIISDGTAYAGIFGVRQSEAESYLEHLRGARDRLNLAKTIHLLDLNELIAKDDAARKACGMRTHASLRRRIRREIEKLARAEDPCARAVRTLSFGMRWNVNTRRHLESGDVSAADLWSWLRRSPRSRVDEPRVPESLAGAPDEAAVEYAAFNLALGFTQLLRRQFPAAVRLTSHAKPGQVMAPRVGSVFPWNGVPVVTDLRQDDLRASSIKCLELHSALSSRLRPVFERNGRQPICYTEGS
jgi:hypothetical protein